MPPADATKPMMRRPNNHSTSTKLLTEQRNVMKPPYRRMAVDKPTTVPITIAMGSCSTPDMTFTTSYDTEQLLATPTTTSPRWSNTHCTCHCPAATLASRVPGPTRLLGTNPRSSHSKRREHHSSRQDWHLKRLSGIRSGCGLFRSGPQNVSKPRCGWQIPKPPNHSTPLP